jgi:hypothetical protein
MEQLSVQLQSLPASQYSKPACSHYLPFQAHLNSQLLALWVLEVAHFLESQLHHC